MGKDVKGKISVVLYAAAIPLAFVSQWIADAIYVSVALMWLVPDRRIESKFASLNAAAQSFVTMSPTRITPGTTTFALRPRSRSVLALGRVHEFHRVSPEALRELPAARMRPLGDFDDGRPEGDACSRRQIVRAQIQIDVQLIPCERPAIGRLRHERNRARVHDVELHVRMGRPSPAVPRVADEPMRGIQMGLFEHLARADLRPAHDQTQHPSVLRRPADLVQTRFQLRQGQMFPGHGGRDLTLRRRRISVLEPVSRSNREAGRARPDRSRRRSIGRCGRRTRDRSYA